MYTCSDIRCDTDVSCLCAVLPTNVLCSTLLTTSPRWQDTPRSRYGPVQLNSFHTHATRTITNIHNTSHELPAQCFSLGAHVVRLTPHDRAHVASRLLCTSTSAYAWLPRSAACVPLQVACVPVSCILTHRCTCCCPAAPARVVSRVLSTCPTHVPPWPYRSQSSTWTSAPSAGRTARRRRRGCRWSRVAMCAACLTAAVCHSLST